MPRNFIRMFCGKSPSYLSSFICLSSEVILFFHDISCHFSSVLYWWSYFELSCLVTRTLCCLSFQIYSQLSESSNLSSSLTQLVILRKPLIETWTQFDSGDKSPISSVSLMAKLWPQLCATFDIIIWSWIGLRQRPTELYPALKAAYMPLFVMDNDDTTPLKSGYGCLGEPCCMCGFNQSDKGAKVWWTWSVWSFFNSFCW